MNYKKDITLKEIVVSTLKIIKNQKTIHGFNLTIWLIISIIPLLYGISIKYMYLGLANFDKRQYITFLVTYMLLLILNAISSYLGGIFDTKSRFFIGEQTRSNIFAHFISNKTDVKHNQILNMMNTDITTIEEFVSFTFDFINKIIFFIFAFIILSLINLKMTLLVFLPILIATFIIYSFGEKIKSHYFEAKSKDVNHINDLSVLLEGNFVVRNLNNLNNITNELELRYKQRSKINIKKNVLFELIERLTELFNNTTFIVVMLSSIYLLSGKNEVADFVIFIQYLSYGTIYLTVFQEIFIRYKSIQGFYVDIVKNGKVPREELLSTKPISSSMIIEFPIQFRNYTLNNSVERLNVNINEKELIVITGENELFKADFINSLINHDGNSNILFNNNHIAFSTVFNAGFADTKSNLFDDTIKSNITMFNEYNELKMNKCLQSSNLFDENIKELLISDIHTVGKGGAKLSEGQKQRVTIARAFYSDSNILIFNNCFSSIDEDSRSIILQNILAEDRTVILVTDSLEDIINKRKFKNIRFGINCIEVLSYD